MEAATTVGSTWIGEEDAPSVEDLHTELSWLLDDAVVSIACDGGEGGSGWRDAERRLLQRSPPEHLESCVVTMREGLEELGEKIK